MEIWDTEEWRRSWCSGRLMSLAFWDGKTMRWVQSLRAASNCNAFLAKLKAWGICFARTNGMISAGCVVSLLASSSL